MLDILWTDHQIFQCDPLTLAVRNLLSENFIRATANWGKIMGQKAPLQPPKRRRKRRAKTDLARLMAEIVALRRVLIAAELRYQTMH
jgi:hypothetical protein